METQYYVDINGNYIGGFDGVGALSLVPIDSVEVPSAPDCAWYIWDGQEWVVTDPPS